MQWWLQIGANLDRESARVRLQCGLTHHHFGECNVCKYNATKAKTQEIKNELATGRCGIDAFCGHAKPD